MSDGFLQRDQQALRLCIVAGVLFMLLAHLTALWMSGGSAAATPISQLSRGDGALVHTAGLLVLAVIHPLLARLLWPGAPGSTLWRTGCVLMVLNTALLCFIAGYFAWAPDARLIGPDANDPLAVFASSVGVVMGCLQPALSRRAPRCAWLNALLLVLWLALVPVIPFIQDGWLGAYERSVGVLLLLWLALLALAAPATATGEASR